MIQTDFFTGNKQSIFVQRDKADKMFKRGKIVKKNNENKITMSFIEIYYASLVRALNFLGCNKKQ